MNKIRVAELFSGYGSQSMALARLKQNTPPDYKFDYEVVIISEIEPNALKAYEATHGYCPNVGDISKVNWDEQPDFDLATWSFPCTDISGAGKQLGLSKNSGTRSSLAWEAIRCFKAKRPKYLLMENVAALAQQKFIRDFHELQYELEQIGYTNFCAVLDAKDYGVPQHRERLFMVSILDCDKSYHFPKPFKLEKRIRDILEPYGTVDESYYYTAKQLCSMFNYTAKKKNEGNGFQTSFQTEDSIACCVTTRYGASYTGTYLKEPAIHQCLSLYDNNAQAGRVYDIEGISPCIDTCSGGNRQPKILTPVRSEEAKRLRRIGIETFAYRELKPREDGISNTVTTFDKDNLLIEPSIKQLPHGWNQGNEYKDVSPTITTSSWEANNLLREPIGVAQRGRNPQNPSDRTKGSPTQQRLEFGDNVANCITTVQKDSMVAEPMESLLCNLPNKTVLSDEDGCGYLWQDNSLWRIRKLIPIEVGRLMDVSDEDVLRMIDAGIAKTKLYCLFGNSIVVNVLCHIFRKMWIDTENESEQKSIFDL